MAIEDAVGFAVTAVVIVVVHEAVEVDEALEDRIAVIAVVVATIEVVEVDEALEDRIEVIAVVVATIVAVVEVIEVVVAAVVVAVAVVVLYRSKYSSESCHRRHSSYPYVS